MRVSYWFEFPSKKPLEIFGEETDSKQICLSVTPRKGTYLGQTALSELSGLKSVRPKRFDLRT